MSRIRRLNIMFVFRELMMPGEINVRMKRRVAVDKEQCSDRNLHLRDLYTSLLFCFNHTGLNHRAKLREECPIHHTRKSRLTRRQRRYINGDSTIADARSII